MEQELLQNGEMRIY